MGIYDSESTPETPKKVKISNCFFFMIFYDSYQINHRKYENQNPETQGSTLKVRGPKKIFKKDKNLKSKFRDFQLCKIQIDNEESENYGPDKLEQPSRLHPRGQFGL